MSVWGQVPTVFLLNIWLFYVFVIEFEIHVIKEPGIRSLPLCLSSLSHSLFWKPYVFKYGSLCCLMFLNLSISISLEGEASENIA